MGGFWSDMRNLGKQVVGCVCFLLCLGPVMMIVGIAFLIAASNDSRKSELNQYNDAVNTWNSQISNFQNAWFNASTQLIQVGPGNDGMSLIDYTTYSDGLIYSMPVYHPSDLLNDSPQSGETFNSYTTFDFGWPQSPPAYGPPVATSLPSDVEVYRMNIYDPSGNPLIPGNVDRINTYLETTIDVTGSCNTVSCMANNCVNQMGVWNSNTDTCYVYYRLRSICIKVIPVNAQNTQWQVAANLGASDFGGCVWSDGVPGLYLSGLEPFVYERFAYNPQNPQLNSFSWLTLNVRFYTDPYVVAQYVTQGSLNFGLTVHQKLVTGIACLVVGIAYSLCLCGLVYYCVRKRTQQNSQYYAQNDVSGGYGSMPAQPAPVMGTPVMAGQPVYGSSGPGMYAPPAQGYQQY